MFRHKHEWKYYSNDRSRQDDDRRICILCDREEENFSGSWQQTRITIARGYPILDEDNMCFLVAFGSIVVWLVGTILLARVCGVF